MLKKYRLQTSRPVTDIIQFQLLERRKIPWLFKVIDQATMPEHLARVKPLFLQKCGEIITRHKIPANKLSIRYKH